MINGADTAFILAAGLVLLMTPGLALFYGGMVRSKIILRIRFCWPKCSNSYFLGTYQSPYATLGMRLTQENEVQGMDYAEHSETAYN